MSKRAKKTTQPTWRHWVSASKTRNYFLDNTLQDWLFLYGKAKGYGNSPPSVTDFTRYIMQRGIDFEDRIITQLRRKFGHNVVQITSTGYESQEYRKYCQTKGAMEEGVPIIYQGVVWDEAHQTYGIPDLLVRSDYVNQLTDGNYIDDVFHEGEYYYVVVDIKFSTLDLTADGKHLLNCGSFKAYKGQLAIYTMALKEMQGFEPPCAYVLGRKWKYTSKGVKYSGTSCFEKLGVIDYSDRDYSYRGASLSACDWIRKLRKEGKKWKVDPPSIPELYPNMSIDHPAEWRATMQKIAEDCGELTLVWQVGVKNRKKAHDEGVFRWDDEDCFPEILGIGGKRAPIVEAIIEGNKQNERKVSPLVITSNEYNWHQRDSLELFVDFETVSDVVSDLDRIPEVEDVNMIFMVGCGWYHNGEWRYRNFTVNDFLHSEEARILNEFNSLVKTLKQEYSSECPKLIHWGKAEFSHFSNACDRHTNQWPELENWFDMNDCIFLEEPVVVKGCFGFGLKPIAKTLHSAGLIETTWDGNNPCADGMSAMITMADCVSMSKKIEKPIEEFHSVRKIVEYNEVDCRVLGEILEYLRKAHVPKCLV